MAGVEHRDRRRRVDRRSSRAATGRVRDPMRRALVVNAYSTGNWGDTAIVEGLIGSLRSAGYDEVTIAPVDWRSGASAWRTLGADGVVPPLLSVADVSPLLRRPKAARLAADLPRLAISPARATTRRRIDARVPRRRHRRLGRRGLPRGSACRWHNFLKLANIRAASMIQKRTVVAPVTVNPFSSAVRRLRSMGARRRVDVRPRGPQPRTPGCERVPSMLGMDLAFAAPTLRTIATSAVAAAGRDPAGSAGRRARTGPTMMTGAARRSPSRRRSRRSARCSPRPRIG